MASVKYKTRRGFADPSGPDFEWKYASLLFLRGVNRTSRFYLATNMEGVGKFDDIVYLFREDKRMKACFMQLKHKQNSNYQVQRTSLLDTVGEFSIPLLCESYHKALRRVPLLANNLGIEISLDDVFVALVTNAKVEGVRGHRLRDMLTNAGGKVISFTQQSDPDIHKHMEELMTYKMFLEKLENLIDCGEDKSQLYATLHSYLHDYGESTFARKAERMLMNSNVEEKIREQLLEYRSLENLQSFSEFLAHFKIYHRQESESTMLPLLLEEFNLACGTTYNEKSPAFLHFISTMKMWKNQKDDYKLFLSRRASVWKDTLMFSLSERVLHEIGQLGVKFQEISLVPITRAVSRYCIVKVRSDSQDCSLTILKVHAALAQLGARHVLVRESTLVTRRHQLRSVWQPPRAPVVVLWLEECPAAEEQARRWRPVDGRLVIVSPPRLSSHKIFSSESSEIDPMSSKLRGLKRKRSFHFTSSSSDSETNTVDDVLAEIAERQPSALTDSAHQVVTPLVEQMVNQAVNHVANRASSSSRHRHRSRRRTHSGGSTGGSDGASTSNGCCARVEGLGVVSGRHVDSESDSELDEKHDRFVRRLERQRPGPARMALWDSCLSQMVTDAPPGEARLNDECSLRQLRRPPHLLGKPIRFQGQTVTLHELLVSDPRLAHALSGDALAYLLRTEEPVVGAPPPLALDYFVERKLLRASRATRALLAAVAAAPPGIALAFSGVSVKQLQELLPPGCRAVQLCVRAQHSPGDLKFVSISHELAEDALTFLQTQPELHSVHWFYVDGANMTMHWVRSHGDVNFLRPYLSLEVDQYVAAELPERVVLIVGKPGLGKSTLIGSVASRLKERDRTSWVVRVNLNTYSSFLDKEQITAKRAIEMLQDAAIPADKNNPLAEKFFKHCVTESGRVIILLDGFDEVCFRHTDKALQLLKEIRNTKIQQLWVTSREVLKHTLETTLSTYAFTLRGFDDINQRKFFKEFWERNIPDAPPSRLDKFIQEFLKVVRLSNLTKNGMQIPLETMMMAEAFQMQAEAYCRNNDAEIDLPTCIDLMDLYRRFVFNKYDIKFRKDAVDKTRAGFDHMFRMLTNDYTQSHQLLALAFLFSPQDLHDLEPNDLAERVEGLVRNEQTNANLEKVGIVTCVHDSVPCFIHRNFAEFFAAQWLAENSAANRDFLKKKLFEPEYHDMRVMFDRLLARDSELNRSIVFEDKKMMTRCLEGRHCPRRLDRGGRAALHLAAAYGRAQLVQPLVAAGADLEQIDSLFEWRPLQYAEHANAWDAAESLLVAGAEPAPLADAVDKLSDATFVATCARGGHIKLLQFAVEAGAANLSAPVTACGRSPLHLACEEGQALAVEYLLAAGLSAAAADRDGATPLHLAAARGHTNVARRLLGCGGEVNATDALRSSPLLVAAAEGHLDTVRTLVESGADVNLPGPLDTTPLHWAAGRGFDGVVRYLLANHAEAGTADAERCTPLHEAAAGGHEAAAVALLAAGAVADAVDADGLTPLHAAAQRGHTQLVEMLSSCSHAVDARDEHGRRPVHLAAAEAHTEAVQALVRAGANLQVADREGQLALHLAAQSGHVDLIRYLVEEGSDVNSVDNHVQTPLHYAVSEGHEEAMMYLVDAGANVMAADNRGWSPAHVAVRHGHTKALAYLIEKGADIDQPAICGATPLHLAAEAGHQEMVRLLVECGADLNLMDKQGRRPVHVAAANGLVDTANYLVAVGADTRLPNSQAGDRGVGTEAPTTNVTIATPYGAYDAFGDLD